VLFVGVDWGEAHHDVCVLDEAGTTLARARIVEGLEGLRRLHELVAHELDGDDPGQVVVGIETERGLLVRGLLAAGYVLYALNPLAVSRYRERHATSGAKSDAGDAKVLADLVRTDRHNHRALSPDSEELEAVKVLARAHQGMAWSRQRQLQSLRSALREYYPAALLAFPELGAAEALEVLAIAPTPVQGRGLSRSKIQSALRRAGRVRRVEARRARSRRRFAPRIPRRRRSWPMPSGVRQPRRSPSPARSASRSKRSRRSSASVFYGTRTLRS
jgi:transposase